MLSNLNYAVKEEIRRNILTFRMQESIQDSIIRLLRYQRAPVGVTQRFRSWKHNADILPKLQEQLETVLGAYGKFQPIVYDTQGIRDDGVDITLSYHPEGSSDQKMVIGFQVKSFDRFKGVELPAID
jgi:hypothetical protein